MNQTENQWQDNYIAGQNYRFRNLCDTCQQQIPTCKSSLWKYGDGVGKDNVIECDGYQEQNILFILAAKLSDAKAKKEALKAQQTETQALIDETEEKLGQLMIEEEMQNFNKNGVTYYLTTKLNCNAVAGQQEELFRVLREEGAASLVKETVNANSLKAWVKEKLEENEGELPRNLEGLVNIFERSICGTRKGSK